MEPTTNIESKSYGAVVASIIIILLLIVGGLYFWGQTLSQREAVTSAQKATQEQPVVVADDSVSSIEADLNADAEFKDIEAGLKEI